MFKKEKEINCVRHTKWTNEIINNILNRLFNNLDIIIYQKTENVSVIDDGTMDHRFSYRGKLNSPNLFDVVINFDSDIDNATMGVILLRDCKELDESEHPVINIIINGDTVEIQKKLSTLFDKCKIYESLLMFSAYFYESDKNKYNDYAGIRKILILNKYSFSADLDNHHSLEKAFILRGYDKNWWNRITIDILAEDAHRKMC
jgi:hypothetical protein